MWPQILPDLSMQPRVILYSPTRVATGPSGPVHESSGTSSPGYPKSHEGHHATGCMSIVTYTCTIYSACYLHGSSEEATMHVCPTDVHAQVQLKCSQSTCPTASHATVWCEARINFKPAMCTRSAATLIHKYEFIFYRAEYSISLN